MAGTALPVLVLILPAGLGFPPLSPAWDLYKIGVSFPPICLVPKSSAPPLGLAGVLPILCIYVAPLAFCKCRPKKLC